TFSSNALNATLVDTSGFLYGAESSIVLEGGIELLEVSPGEMVRGWVGFVIPQDATPAILRYQFYGSGAVLQVGLGSISAVSAASITLENSSNGTSAETPTVTPTNTGSPSPTPPPSTNTPEAAGQGPGLVANT